jgi:hypothetical protein
MKVYGEVDVHIHVFLISAPGGSEWSALTPGTESPAHIGYEVGGPEDRFGRHGKKKILASTGTRTPTRPSSSQSLYRLPIPGSREEKLNL